MNTINISSGKSKVFGGFDVMALRFSLMVSDITCTAGDLYMGIFADQDLNKESKTMKSKFDLVLLHLRTSPDIVETQLEEVEQMQMMYKYLMNVKFKTPEQIKHLKAIERIIESTYAELSDNLSDNFSRVGITQLKKFAENELLINAVNIVNPELIDDAGEFLKMSEVLLDKFDYETLDDIYLVTGNFGEYLKEQNIEIGELGGKKNKNAKILRAQNVMVFPPVTALTGDELELVRDHLLSTNQTFRTNMEMWSAILLTTPFNSDHYNSISEQFTKTILPYTQLLQTEIEKNKRLQLKRDRTEHSIEFRISFYVCDIDLYWVYLIDIGTVEADTMNVLKDYPDYQNLIKKSCIIIECNLHHPDEIKNDDPETSILTKRKVLDS